MNGEIRAIHPAEIAATTLLGMNDMRRMVSLGVEGRGERQYLGGAKLHAELAGLAALDDDGNPSLWHVSPCSKLNKLSTRVLSARCDGGHEPM